MKYKLKLEKCNISRHQDIKNQNNLSQNIIHSIFEGLIKSVSCKNLYFGV